MFLFIYFYFFKSNIGSCRSFCLCSGLQEYLNQQGFHIVGYGCTTCIGNSGDLNESVASAISENGTVAIYAINIIEFTFIILFNFFSILICFCVCVFLLFFSCGGGFFFSRRGVRGGGVLVL